MKEVSITIRCNLCGSLLPPDHDQWVLDLPVTAGPVTMPNGRRWSWNGTVDLCGECSVTFIRTLGTPGRIPTGLARTGAAHDTSGEVIETQQPFTCPDCGKEYRSYSGMHSHRARVHKVRKGGRSK